MKPPPFFFLLCHVSKYSQQNAIVRQYKIKQRTLDMYSETCVFSIFTSN